MGTNVLFEKNESLEKEIKDLNLRFEDETDVNARQIFRKNELHIEYP